MSRMTIPQLEAFFWTSELGSVHRAAEQLNITQPTLSLRLKQLEAALPSPILERNGRGVKLTREGHTFLSHVKIVLNAYRELEKSTSVPEIAGVLRIGLAEGFAVACMPGLISALESDFPLLRPEWTIATSCGLEQSLCDSELDIAVLVDPVGLRDIRLAGLGLQRNAWAIPAMLSGRTGNRPRDLAQHTIITTPPPTAMYRSTIGWFAEEKISPEKICICSSLNAAMHLVAAGLGLGIFPAKMIDAYALGGAIQKLMPVPPLTDGRVFVADRATSDIARTAAFIRTLERAIQSIGYFA